MKAPTAKTVRAGIRASVPDGKLRKARIVLTSEGFRAGSIGGYTQYEREHGGDVIKLGAPIGDKSKDVTIRGHETRHATRHKPQRKKPMTQNGEMASQIVDDVNIECTPIPNVKSQRAYRRAHLAVGANDLRSLKRHARQVLKGMPTTVGDRNWQLLLAVRVAAMLRHYGKTGHPYGGYGSMPHLPDCEKVREKGERALQRMLGSKTMSAIRKVIALAQKRRGRNRAISMLEAMMEVELTPEEEEREEEELRRDGDILLPPKEGDSLEGEMKITNLIPKTIPCAKEKQIHRRFSPDGVMINGGRFVNAIASGDANGLFMRRVRQKPGGTILIDASGSMHANAKNLTALCELCPTATVAYYSGFGSKGRGELCVYALNGRRYPKELPQKTIHGGNAVDLAAIRWMMRLPKPWTLISDLGFCGGVLGSEQVAHALVERAVQRGDLTVHRSLDAAYEAFGGKGELKNA
jgi:hypothetical protein